MWVTRYVLPFAVALAALLACLAPREPEPAATISARALLNLAQRTGGANYTFSRETSAALEAASVPHPGANASLPQLESALTEAGFRLRRRGAGEHELFLVERAGD